MFQFRSRGVGERLKIRNVDSVYVSVSFERSRRAFEDQKCRFCLCFSFVREESASV